LDKNEKVDHHERKKTHNPIVLRFWLESVVNLLYELGTNHNISRITI